MRCGNGSKTEKEKHDRKTCQKSERERAHIRERYKMKRGDERISGGGEEADGTR